MVIESFGASDTFALGREIGKAARPGQVYSLTGDLGAGKTVFTQGVAAGLGIEEPVNSPTFTILQVYEATECVWWSGPISSGSFCQRIILK